MRKICPLKLKRCIFVKTIKIGCRRKTLLKTPTYKICTQDGKSYKFSKMDKCPKKEESV